jgi:hypothetical protein
MLSNFRQRDSIPTGFVEATNGDRDSAWLVALTTNEAVMAIGIAMRFIRATGREVGEADLPVLQRAGMAAWEIALFEIAADPATSQEVRDRTIVAWNDYQVTVKGMIKQLARNMLRG